LQTIFGFIRIAFVIKVLGPDASSFRHRLLNCFADWLRCAATATNNPKHVRSS
jgi:hypothetical protein